ncbi:MAG TPA: pitrilysin family protein [Burkholderiaceae bacterium]|nr:pitrilysin family protein [Burkholderiaceae bacterium]
MPIFFHRLARRAGELLALALVTAPAWALTLPAGVTRGPSVQGVTQYTLTNGLRVVLANDDSQSTTTVNMTYLAGADRENYGQAGMAHVLEHMMFRGTPRLRDPMAAFSRRGLAANGSTTNDRTSFYATFAADPKTLDWFLDWQADEMVHALLSPEDLTTERKVVLSEMERDNNSPVQVLLQTMRSTAYQWNHYGHTAMGTRSDVESVNVGELRTFYHKYYQPDDAVLVITGRFDPAQTLRVIATAFGKIPRPTRPLLPDHTVEPVQDGARQVTLRRHGGSPYVGALYHIPQAASPQYIPVSLGVAILTDTPSGRLYHALVKTRLSTSIDGFAAAMRQPGYAFFGAQLAPTIDPDKALAAMEKVLDSIGSRPFTQEELGRIKREWLTGWDQTYADPGALAAALASASAHGDWRLFFLDRDRVKNATLAQVQDATQAYLVGSNRTTGQYLPTIDPVRAPASTPVDLAALFKHFQGGKAPVAVPAFDASPANIDARTQRHSLHLPNGTVKLALLSKPTRGDTVQALMLLRFGNVEDLRGTRSVSRAVANLLDNGTTDMTRQQIQDRFNQLQANVDFSGSGGAVVVNLSCKGEYLPQVTALVLKILRQADFPESELANYQRQAAASIEDAMSSPNARAAQALARHDNPWPKDDIRYTPSFDETLHAVQSLTRQDLLDFHNKFYGTGNIEFSAVGQFDTKALEQALTAGLKGWHKAPAHQRVPNPYRAVPPQTFTLNTPGKTNAVYLSTLPVKVKDSDADYPALFLANYLLGGSETSRLWNRLRVQDGLSYTVQSSLDVSSHEPSGQWSIYAITAPKNTSHVQSDVAAVLAEVLSKGFTPEEVKQGIASILNYRKLQLTRDGAVASTWIDYMRLGRDYTWWSDLDKKLAGLTASKVNAALRAVLRPSQFSTAIAEDVAAAKQPQAVPAGKKPETKSPGESQGPGPQKRSAPLSGEQGVN